MNHLKFLKLQLFQHKNSFNCIMHRINLVNRFFIIIFNNFLLQLLRQAKNFHQSNKERSIVEWRKNTSKNAELRNLAKPVARVPLATISHIFELISTAVNWGVPTKSNLQNIFQAIFFVKSVIVFPPLLLLFSLSTLTLYRLGVNEFFIILHDKWLFAGLNSCRACKLSLNLCFTLNLLTCGALINALPPSTSAPLYVCTS